MYLKDVTTGDFRVSVNPENRNVILKLFRQTNVEGKITRTFVDKPIVSEIDQNAIKDVVIGVIEDLFSKVRISNEKIRNDTRLQSTQDRNIRISKNGTIRHLEEYVSLYVMLRKRTEFVSCAKLLLNGSYTYQTLCFILANGDLTESFERFSLQSSEQGISEGNDRVGVIRTYYTLRDELNSYCSIQINKELKVNIFVKKNTQNDQSKLKRNEVVKKFDFSDTESIRYTQGSKDLKMLKSVPTLLENNDDNSNRSLDTNSQVKNDSDTFKTLTNTPKSGRQSLIKSSTPTSTKVTIDGNIRELKQENVTMDLYLTFTTSQCI